MKKIYKYRLDPAVDPETQPMIFMPKGAKILHFNTQQVAGLGSAIFMWAEVDTQQEDEARTFYILMTGQKIPEFEHATLYYLDTVHLRDIGIVAHIYEFKLTQK